MSRWLNASSAQAFNGFLAIWDEDKFDLYRAADNWSWEGRHATLCRAQGAQWRDLWTPPAPTLNFNGQAISFPVSGGWAPWSLGESGYIRLAYFNGTCRDANGAAISGAVVTSFRTSDCAEGGSTTTNSDGTYSCPTPYLGVAHFLVAYLDTTTDLAGTSINTLIPTIP
jgi:hypothetical protein